MNKKSKVKFTASQPIQFFPVLRSRVEEYFTNNNINRFSNGNIWLKTAILLGLYLLPFFVILSVPLSLSLQFVLWSIMGFGMAGVGMSVMHDANHGAYSENKVINTIMTYVLNFLGGSVFNWKLQHNILHHTYTNITNKDEDIDNKLVLRFSPHTKRAGFLKFQWIYAFVLYGVLTLYWVTLKDFFQFVRYTRNGVNNNSRAQNVITVLRITFMKLCYLFVAIILPVVILDMPFGQIVAGFLIMHFVAGIILTTTFQLAHTVEGTTHPLPNEKGIIENDWAVHQMHTTVNFSTRNKFLTWYLGGLNFQVEHHLFPKISHVHYPALSAIVKQTAKEFKVPYLENETLGDAVTSHIRTLKRMGEMPDMNEALA
jgi:linoleoyl-CoA desaturase